MLPTRTPRVTRNGRTADYSQDKATEARLWWALHVATQSLGVECNISTIIRAAVAAYVHTLEEVLEAGPDSTQALYAKMRLAQANAAHPLGVSKEMACVLPVTKLSSIIAAHLAAHPAKLARMRDRGTMLPAATTAALAKAYNESQQAGEATK